MEDAKLQQMRQQSLTRGGGRWLPLNVGRMVLATVVLIVASWAMLFEHWFWGWALMILGGVLSLMTYKVSK